MIVSATAMRLVMVAMPVRGREEWKEALAVAPWSRQKDPVVARQPQALKLLAGVAALTAGTLFAVMPGHSDATFRFGIGVIWLLTGCLWLLAWRRQRRRSA